MNLIVRDIIWPSSATSAAHPSELRQTQRMSVVASVGYRTRTIHLLEPPFSVFLNASSPLSGTKKHFPCHGTPRELSFLRVATLASCLGITRPTSTALQALFFQHVSFSSFLSQSLFIEYSFRHLEVCLVHSWRLWLDFGSGFGFFAAFSTRRPRPSAGRIGLQARAIPIQVC
jgi:hypothetical protein